MLGTPPAFILSQDQTLDKFLYTVPSGTTYLFYRAFYLLLFLLCWVFLLTLFRNCEILHFQFLSTHFLFNSLYFSRHQISSRKSNVCCSIFKDQTNSPSRILLYFMLQFSALKLTAYLLYNNLFQKSSLFLKVFLLFPNFFRYSDFLDKFQSCFCDKCIII